MEIYYQYRYIVLQYFDMVHWTGKWYFVFLQHLIFYGQWQKVWDTETNDTKDTVHELITHFHYQLQLMSSFAGIKWRSYLAAKAMGSPEDNRRVGGNIWKEFWYLLSMVKSFKNVCLFCLLNLYKLRRNANCYAFYISAPPSWL